MEKISVRINKVIRQFSIENKGVDLLRKVKIFLKSIGCEDILVTEELGGLQVSYSSDAINLNTLSGYEPTDDDTISTDDALQLLLDKVAILSELEEKLIVDMYNSKIMPTQKLHGILDKKIATIESLVEVTKFALSMKDKIDAM